MSGVAAPVAATASPGSVIWGEACGETELPCGCMYGVRSTPYAPRPARLRAQPPPGLGITVGLVGPTECRNVLRLTGFVLKLRIARLFLARAGETCKQAMIYLHCCQITPSTRARTNWSIFSRFHCPARSRVVTRVSLLPAPRTATSSENMREVNCCRSVSRIASCPPNTVDGAVTCHVASQGAAGTGS